MASNMPQAYEHKEHPVLAAARRSGADIDAMLKAGDVDGIAAAAQQADPGFSTDQGVQYLDDFAKKMGKNLGGGSAQDANTDNMLRGIKMQDRGLNRGWGNNPPLEPSEPPISGMFKSMPEALGGAPAKKDAGQGQAAGSDPYRAALGGEPQKQPQLENLINMQLDGKVPTMIGNNDKWRLGPNTEAVNSGLNQATESYARSQEIRQRRRDGNMDQPLTGAVGLSDEEARRRSEWFAQHNR